VVGWMPSLLRHAHALDEACRREEFFPVEQVPTRAVRSPNYTRRSLFVR